MFAAGTRGSGRSVRTWTPSTFPRERYDLIVNTLYLNRRLFPQIGEGLRPGGLLIFETLLEPPGGAGHGERCRDYFLKPNELLHGFLSLRILHYRETGAVKGKRASR